MGFGFRPPSKSRRTLGDQTGLADKEADPSASSLDDVAWWRPYGESVALPAAERGHAPPPGPHRVGKGGASTHED